MRALFWALAAAWLSLLFPGLAHSEDLKQAYVAALKDPYDPQAFEALLKALPTTASPLDKSRTFYLVEGDIPMSEREVRAYLLTRSTAPQSAEQKPELIVHMHAGQPAYWEDPNKRELRYSVIKSTFPDEASYRKVVQDIAAAGAAWQAACRSCNIKFVYNRAHDGITTMDEFKQLASTDKLRFAVVYQQLGGGAIAMAFFPNEPIERRLVSIDPSYFDLTGGPGTFPPEGVLRHELGHVLGYRHEHTRGVAGCDFEDNDWKPLTPYDAHSVMHYFCGGKGTLQLKLSDVDIAGHTKLYGIAATGATSP